MEMSKKITLLALAVLSTAAFALPSTGMAVEEDVPLHLIPKPEKQSTVASGQVKLSQASGVAIVCEKTVGVANWESTTTGKISLTISGCKFGLEHPCENVEAKELPFHLVTLPGAKPGILITPPASGVFGKFPCFGTNIEGNGLIGTITAPACGGESSTATIKFETVEFGMQKHKKVEGTETVYFLTTGEPKVAAALETELTMTFEGKKKLECT
jgi:hypothetical protein